MPKIQYEQLTFADDLMFCKILQNNPRLRKEYMDFNNYLQMAREEGLQKGLSKDREEGLQKGLSKGREEGLQVGRAAAEAAAKEIQALKEQIAAMQAAVKQA